MERLALTTCLAIVLLLFTAAASAQQKEMYRWTDKDGVVHFSDTKPSGLEVRPESLPPGDAPAATDHPYPVESAADGPSVAQQRREEIAQRSKDARDQQAERSSQCASWQAEVARLEPNRRVYFTNEQGETERMDDIARTDRVAELKALIAENCR